MQILYGTDIKAAVYDLYKEFFFLEFFWNCHYVGIA